MPGRSVSSVQSKSLYICPLVNICMSDKVIVDCSKSVSNGVKHHLLYQQLHGLNEELTPPTMGCLFPVWYKGNSQLSLSELKAISDTKKAAFAAKLDTNTSYKMSALNRWTVS